MSFKIVTRSAEFTNSCASHSPDFFKSGNPHIGRAVCGTSLSITTNIYDPGPTVQLHLRRILSLQKTTKAAALLKRYSLLISSECAELQRITIAYLFHLLNSSWHVSAKLHWLVCSFTAACAESNCNDYSGDYDSALHGLLSYAVPGLAEPNQHKI